MTDAIVQALADARLENVRLADAPGETPATPAEAYALQDRVTKALGWTVVGWKGGATNPAAQQLLGVDGPFAGPIFAERAYASPARVETCADALRVTEAEFAFRLGRDLAPRAEPYTVEEVRAAIASVHPAIEVVNRRIAGGMAGVGPWLIADGGANDAFVYGPGFEDLDAIDFTAHPVTVSVNGKERAKGSAANVLGNPFNVLVWLADHSSASGAGLKAGQWISTGLTTEVFTCETGDRVEADFGPIGKVALQY